MNLLSNTQSNYNSNPSDLASSLETVMSMDSHRRKILVLGEMRELEGFSQMLHQEVGEKLGGLLKNHPAPVQVFGIGEETKALIQGIKKNHPQAECHFSSQVDLAEPQVLALLEPNDILFVKGSRGVALDRIVQKLKSS